MGQGPYMTPPGGMMMQNPEVGTIKTMFMIVRILSMLVGIVALLGAIVITIITLGFGIVFGIFLFIIFLVSLFIFLRIGALRDLVDQGRLQEAKDRTLIWMILGFIFGGVIIGILLLVAYLKFDPAIRWQQQMQMQSGAPQQPGWGAPMASPYGAPQPAPAYGVPAAAAPPPAPTPPAAAAGPVCPKCGRPATWVAQYNRWYCYTDQQYL